MWITKWLWDVFESLGLWKKHAKLLMMGLDNAGKTTLLHLLMNDRIEVVQPTLYPSTEEFTFENCKFTAYDLGSSNSFRNRRLWKDYFPVISGIVFIVDAADPERFEEGKEEIQALLRADTLSSTPILVLGNKTDLPMAVSKDELRHELGLHDTTNDIAPIESVQPPVEVFMCSVVCRQGYQEGLQWLSQHV
ncbi:GTP-binding protein of the ARF family [Lepidopterella palustris CBS 459.81]|uniref:Small COPII coat GTPase SAR1 n=1 Tax=Lepidopterella palustris CBS 459.81 TaxID=1314670 RepID=A0A8E2JFY1_9PEZI|nr:GTP-binding protein of the ARF family [Lepidopterella palustris CBS 459.81]